MTAGCKVFHEGEKLILGSGSWSSLSLSEIALSPEGTPDALLQTPHSTLSVTNPAILAFGASVCDSEKQCHSVGEDHHQFNSH